MVLEICIWVWGIQICYYFCDWTTFNFVNLYLVKTFFNCYCKTNNILLYPWKMSGYTFCNLYSLHTTYATKHSKLPCNYKVMTPVNEKFKQNGSSSLALIRSSTSAANLPLGPRVPYVYSCVTLLLLYTGWRTSIQQQRFPKLGSVRLWQGVRGILLFSCRIQGEKMCKFLYTVISKNLLLKSLLFLFINTRSEADY